MMKLCQRLLDETEMPDEWQTSKLVPIFKDKGDTRSCDVFRVKLLKHAMNIVERVLDKRIRELVNAGAMQFGFMP